MMGTRKRPPRDTPRRPRSANKPLTRAQSERQRTMRNMSVNGQTIADTLGLRGITLTRQAVGNVIRNKFVNEDVIAVFCELTNTTREKAWPDVPPIDDAVDRATSAQLAKLNGAGKKKRR